MVCNLKPIVILILPFCISYVESANTTNSNSSAPATVPCKTNTNFHCNDKSKCIGILQFCDGITDCNDGSDEVRYNASLHSGLPGRSCARLTVTQQKVSCYIPPAHVCNDEIDCFFGNDECGCKDTFHCDPLPFTPPTCRLRVQFCDLIPQCPSKSDEMPYSRGKPGLQCAVTKTHVTNHCMLPQVHVCDGTSDCDEGTDECFCNATGNGYTSTGFLNSKCFRCLDASRVVNRKQVCDSLFHCADLTDECLCPHNPPKICNQVCQYGANCGNCTVGQVQCKPRGNGPRKCINRTQVCDRKVDCPHKEDELNCEINQAQNFQCADGLQFVAKYMHCDNYTDCNDGSDEVNCSSMYKCRRPGYSTTRKYAYLFSRPGYATKCDNIIECNDFDDECNKTICPNANISACDYVQYNKGFICPNSGSGLLGKEICDGFPTCNSTAPHLSADEYNCTNRYYCADNGKSGLPIHIPLNLRCNRITDCNDVSDEMGCNLTTHFYCASGTPKYVPRNKVCNGIQECQGGEDECQNCSTSPFSSDSFLISSYVLQVIVWIIGLCAIFGNSAVIIHNTREMFKPSIGRTSVGFINRILVLNLALADLILGLYLVGLGIVNSVFAHVYCKRDVQWRGSTACSVLGCLAVISVEVSVFTLAIMSSYRLFAVYRPFSAGKKKWLVGVIIIAAWFAAMVLAFVPLSFDRRDYFVSGLWYRNNPYLETPSRTHVEQFVTTLRSFQDQTNKNFTAGQPSALTWTSITETIAKLVPTLVPELYFGYYSAHGVCLPRLFPIPSLDRAWGYSLMIIIINFCTFIYMVAAYITIYRKTTKQAQKAGRGDSKSTFLQRKISRIVITNFCCWIPICIMAFISVSGVTMSSEAYAAAAIVLLPINSAANPFLYSDLPDILWKKTQPIRDTVSGIWSTTKEGDKSNIRRTQGARGSDAATTDTKL